jgi:hypothetical protein
MSAPVFTNWDFLDPVSMGNKLAIAHGAPVWDNYSLLDPARAEAQINLLSPNAPVFTPLIPLYDSKLTPAAAEAPNPDWSLADAIGSI